MNKISVEDLPYRQLCETLEKLQQELGASEHIREASDYYDLFEKAKEEINKRHEQLFKRLDLYTLLSHVKEFIPEENDDELEAINECISILDQSTE